MPPYLASEFIIDGAEWFQSQLSEWGALGHSDVVCPHNVFVIDPGSDESGLRLRSRRYLFLLLPTLFI